LSEDYDYRLFVVSSPVMILYDLLNFIFKLL